jgi:HTH-type transcriptional regulator/antitoxin MqsA
MRFSRYERAEVPPMPEVVNLFRLLDRHPDLLAELDTPQELTPL